MENPPTELDHRQQHLQTACLLFLSLLAAGVTLWLLRPVLVPFVLALFFVIGLSPILDLIQRRFHFSRVAAIAVSFVLGVALIVSFGLLLWWTINTIADGEPDLSHIVESAVERYNQLLTQLGVQAPDDPAGLDAARAAESATDQYKALLVWLGSALLDLLVSLGVVLIFMFFLLAGASSNARPTTGLWAEIEAKIRGYIVTKTVISFFTGMAFGAVLAVFGVPLQLSLVLGVLAFLLNYVPNVGPVIAAALPVPIVLFLMPDASTLAKVLAVAAGMAVQVVSGNVIEPKIMGDSFQLHPIVILLSLILWGMIWGPVGVLLAVPMTAAVKILLEKLDQTKPVAALLAGKLEPLEAMIDRQGSVG